MAPQTPRGRWPVCESNLGMTVAKAPSAWNVSIQVLEDKYGAQGFSKALQTFVSQYREQNARYTRRRRNEDVWVYVSHVDVWHTLNFNLVTFSSARASLTTSSMWPRQQSTNAPRKQGGLILFLSTILEQRLWGLKVCSCLSNFGIS